MFPIILFVLYLIILSFFLYRLAKKMPGAPEPLAMTMIYLFKTGLGCLYGFIFLRHFGGDDTWNFFNDSLPEYEKMIHHPQTFLQDFLPAAAFNEAHNFWQGMGFYLRNLEYWMMVKLLAFFNIFSRGNYYVDVLFFEFLTIWGPLLLYKILREIFPDARKVLFVVLFCIPTLQFWFSGIRAEGLLLLFMALTLYAFRKKELTTNWRSLLMLIAGFAGLFVFRLPYLLVWIPAYVSSLLSRNQKRKPLFWFLLVYGCCLLAFVLSTWISPQKNLASPIVHRQWSFLALHGKTRLQLDSLQPSVGSFLSQVPQAMGNTLVRPLITEAKGVFQLITAMDIMAGWVLLGLFFFRPASNRKMILGHPMVLLFLFYGLSQILLIGLTVPFPGAIVRYKSIPELFIIITIGLSIDWRLKYYNYS